MPVLSRAVNFFRTLLRSDRQQQELDEELRAFLDARIAHYESRGLSTAAAEREARFDLGGTDQTKELVRDQWAGWTFEMLRRDIRFGFRMLMRTPGFAAVVILTLALAIGANATVFSVMRAVLWRALPYPDSNRIVVFDADAGGLARMGLSDGEAVDLREQSTLFDRLASVARVNAAVSIDDVMEEVPAASATDDALPMLGAVPLQAGRLLEASRDLRSDGFAQSVIISYDLWQRRFGGRAAVGQHIEVNNLNVEVVGVLRPDFRVYLPASAAVPDVADIWFPRPYEHDRRTRGPTTIARLTPGVSIDRARTQLEPLARRFVVNYPADYANGRLHLTVRPLQEAVTAETAPALWALAGAVAFVLLIACVNIGNLMLARARVRAPEMAIRQALGASRLRLLQQLLAEAAILSVAGGAAGLWIAYGGVALVEWLRPAHLPRQSQIHLDGAVVLFVALLSMSVSAAFTVIPAIRSVIADGSLAVGRAQVQRSGARRLQRSLVMAEVALCVVPLVAAGLLLHTFANLVSAPLGFDPDRVLTAKVGYSLRFFPSHDQQLALVTNAIERVGHLPGVRAVSAGGPLPFDVQFLRNYGRAGADETLIAPATLESICPGYLHVTGVQLETGRDFTQDDLVSGRKVAIVDERIARQLWNGGDAIGRRLAIGAGGATPVTEFEIVGVTTAVRAVQVRDAAVPHIFVPFLQFGLTMALVIDTDQPASAMAPAVKGAVESLGTRRPVYDILPLRTYVDRSLGDTRFLMSILLAFAGAALLLAGVGIYGTLAYLTAQRYQEFAVRLALGASAGQVLRGVVGEGLSLTAAGAAMGLAVAMAVTTIFRSLLYEVTPFDPLTLAFVTGTVAIVALAAITQPAIRAARTDPADVLRAQ